MIVSWLFLFQLLYVESRNGNICLNAARIYIFKWQFLSKNFSLQCNKLQGEWACHAVPFRPWVGDGLLNCSSKTAFSPIYPRHWIGQPLNLLFRLHSSSRLCNHYFCLGWQLCCVSMSAVSVADVLPSLLALGSCLPFLVCFLSCFFERYPELMHGKQYN